MQEIHRVVKILIDVEALIEDEGLSELETV